MQEHIERPSDNTSQAPENPVYINLSGYRFLSLEHLPILQAELHAALSASGILGTILLADEGINVALAGTRSQADAARAILDADERFQGIWLKESLSHFRPFSKLKVRIRHEIIAFDGAGARTRQLERPAAPRIAPDTLARWLDEKRDFTLLDTRNVYEIESGTFACAQHLDLAHFRDYQRAVKAAMADGRLDPEKPIVTFCTGGIRCEKAAPWMIEQGFREVYQIDGGILNYFEQTGGRHWHGDCFVFDDRVELDKTLNPTGAQWCNHCQSTMRPGEHCACREQTGPDNPVHL